MNGRGRRRHGRAGRPQPVTAARPHPDRPKTAHPESDDEILPPLPAEAVVPRDDFGEDLFVDLEPGVPANGTLYTLCGVKLKDAGRIYQANCGALSCLRGDRVIVESEHGAAIGTVVAPSGRRVVTNTPAMRVIRYADASDLRQETRNDSRAREVLGLLRRLARMHRLPLKPTHCEIQSGGRRMVFYFSSENRIDFRELVRDLARELGVRVEMRQLGMRDGAKRLGGVGDCGLELCCSTFLPRFEPVSIRMAKDQGMALNPSRVSGQCGRLKCCLVYEHAGYAEALRDLPRVGKFVQTPTGEARVQELDVLRRRVRVRFADGGLETFDASALKFGASHGAEPVSAPVGPE